MGTFTRLYGGQIIRRYQGSEHVSWWCKACDGKHAPRSVQRQAPTFGDAQSAYERHRQMGDHLAAIDRADPIPSHRRTGGT